MIQSKMWYRLFYNANNPLHKNVNDSNEFRKLARVMKNDLDYLTKRDVILKLYINYTGVYKMSEFALYIVVVQKHFPSTYLYFDISICISNNWNWNDSFIEKVGSTISTIDIWFSTSNKESGDELCELSKIR